MLGAFGKMNFTSWNFCRRRQFSASDAQPAPLSPSPWAIMTVAVCLVTAGIISAVGEGILTSEDVGIFQDMIQTIQEMATKC
jgi:hypothetical protein